ncbi:MAG TPA: hypothetical protein ENJ65_00995, partial [Candidatus Tenderia electrophaga]|nr:hypothetical protein [Candidatus Tenderia electrophaga]
MSVDEGQDVDITVMANDPDGDEITVSYSGWMNDRKYSTNYDDAGVHAVTISVSDGKLSVSQDVEVIVNNINRPPQLQTILDIVVNEGEEVSFNPLASDPDGDDLTLTYSGWMTASNYVTGANDQGQYQVTVSVSDGELTASQTIQVKVLDVPPVAEQPGDELDVPPVTQPLEYGLSF